MNSYKESTLKRQTKDWLIFYIKCLEDEVVGLKAMNDRQYMILQSLMKLRDDMKEL